MSTSKDCSCLGEAGLKGGEAPRQLMKIAPDLNEPSSNGHRRMKHCLLLATSGCLLQDCAQSSLCGRVLCCIASGKCTGPEALLATVCLASESNHGCHWNGDRAPNLDMRHAWPTLGHPHSAWTGVAGARLGNLRWQGSIIGSESLVPRSASSSSAAS